MDQHRQREAVVRAWMPWAVWAAAWMAACGVRAAPAHDRLWLPAPAVTSLLGITDVRWQDDALILSNAQHTLRLVVGARRCEIDGTVVWLHAPCEGEPGGDGWRLSQADLNGTLLPILSVAAAPTGGPPPVVVLDPGHGGEDTGACSVLDPDFCEDLFTYDLALRVSNHLARVRVPARLTRAADAFASLAERVALASNAAAAVFVSLHANHADDPQARGIETFIVPFAGWGGTDAGRPAAACEGNRFDAANARLGFAIQSRLASLATQDRGLKRARFAVLRLAPCPAALVECGFLSNQEDAYLLADPAYRESLASAIAAGIAVYLGSSAPPTQTPCAADAAAPRASWNDAVPDK